MQVGVIGVNHKTASLQKREALARFAERTIRDSLFSKHVICLSTCNRFEFYFSHEDLVGTKNQILYALESHISEPFIDNIYTHFDLDCFTHLSRVAAGLDSAVFAESDIQRQVKNAYQKSSQSQPLPSCMHYLFQKALKVGKLLRRGYRMDSRMPDLNSTIWETAQATFGFNHPINVALVGYSEINRRILRFLRYKTPQSISIYTRYSQEAQKIEAEHNCKVYGWDSLRESLEADVIITAAKRSEVIFSAELFKNHSERKQLIFDLSVPRNVDPNLADRSLLKLYNIDQLDQKIRRKQKLIESEITELEELLQSNTARLREIYHTRKRKGLLLQRRKEGISDGLNIPVYVSGF